MGEFQCDKLSWNTQIWVPYHRIFKRGYLILHIVDSKQKQIATSWLNDNKNHIHLFCTKRHQGFQLRGDWIELIVTSSIIVTNVLLGIHINPQQAPHASPLRTNHGTSTLSHTEIKCCVILHLAVHIFITILMTKQITHKANIGSLFFLKEWLTLLLRHQHLHQVNCDQ